MNTERLQKIIEREINRLDIKSEEANLSLNDLKSLELLTRSLKQISSAPEPEENPLSALQDLTDEDLITLIKSIKTDA